MIKWLLILLLLVGCTSITTKQVIYKDEVIFISELKDGKCLYKVKPKPNYTVSVKDICGKYNIGDSLYRVVEEIVINE